MKLFHNILVLVDLDNTNFEALRRACRVAQRNEARLSALAVASEVPPLLGELATRREEGWVQRQKEVVRGEIEQIVAASGIECGINKTTLRTGELASETIREVLRAGYDLVVKDCDRTGVGSGISGRDMRLLRKCPCPVWLVAPPPPGGLGRVLAAVDMKAEAEADQLNRRVVCLAQSLLGLDAGELHVVHAWNEMGLLYWGRRVSVEDYDRCVAELRDRHRNMLTSFLSSLELELPEAQVHLIDNEPAAGIPALAKQIGVSTIVMGTVARSGLSGILMGNTAEQVLRQIDCSVLAIKPDGFVSPIRLT